MTEPDRLEPISDAMLDRLVNGGLSPDELRGVIHSLDDRARRLEADAPWRSSKPRPGASLSGRCPPPRRRLSSR